MGARNPVMPMLRNPVSGGGDFPADARTAFARMRAAREAKNTPAAIAAPAPPVIDLAGNVAAARAAADKVRQKASGANKRAPAPTRPAPKRAPGGIVLNPPPGTWRTY